MRTSHARQPAITSLVESELDPPVPPHHRSLEMKSIFQSILLLLLVSACDQSAQQADTPKPSYEPTEFIRTFDAGKLLSNGWTVKSRSEEKRIYGGEAGSYRRGRVVFVSDALHSEPISDGDIRNGFSTAPGFREITSGVQSEHHFAYGIPGGYDGSIATSVVQSSNKVIVSYELTENP